MNSYQNIKNISIKNYNESSKIHIQHEILAIEAPKNPFLKLEMGLSWWLRGEESACRRPGSISGLEKSHVPQSN